MEKFKQNISYFTLVLLCCTFLYTCSTHRGVNKVTKETKALSSKIEKQDSTISKTVSEDMLKLLIELEGLKISKRNLYDQNAIIRTTVRPDDRMNEYDQEMAEIRKKLENLK